MSSSALMKRARVETFPPKMVRRSAKRGGGGNGPSGRVNESFLTSTHLFVYFRLSIIWIALLSFDFLSGGFRFELLWPTWLLLRSGYDAFAYRSTTAHLPYSAQAFSLFFVCITITSDLLCFLFIPVPLLLFVASSYVWVHHIWQSSDRTFSTPAAVSYAIVILFEYIWRYGYESPWLPYRSIASAMGLSRLLPTRRLDAYDAQAANNFPWPLLMCRPFAAHCLGYPLVMFGFEARMFWTNWRMKRKQREIVKANEYYTELLCTAVPCVYEAGKRYMFSHVSPLGQYDNEVCAEYEMDQQTTTAMLTPALAAPGPSPTSATTPSPASNSSSNASTTTVCGNGNNNNAVALYNGGPGAGGASGGGGLNSVPTPPPLPRNPGLPWLNLALFGPFLKSEAAAARAWNVSEAWFRAFLQSTFCCAQIQNPGNSHKNGNSRLQYLKRHGQANSHGISNGSSHNGTSAHLNGHDDTDTSSERGRSRSPLVVRTRSPMIVRAISRLLRALVVEPLLFLTRFLMNSLSSVGSSAPPETNGSLENYGSWSLTSIPTG
ncbi:hypothetical protein L596_029279 [Steinernema carpocapsae]|uniref:Uncharacterized protein n=1 Tax=Steinernema carpocapsae TaxID=34508 RepID=A0A4U5LU68_STECR|nr:hypothetical protein L596_029279 [Steinernema carpocapsae]